MPGMRNLPPAASEDAPDTETPPSRRVVGSSPIPVGGAGGHLSHPTPAPSSCRPIWIRPSGAGLWADPGGCWASATFEPPERGTDETEHTLRGSRLHAAVASLVRPGKFPRPTLEDGEWQTAQRAISLLQDFVVVDVFDWRPEERIERRMGTHGQVLMDGTPDLVGVSRHYGFGLTGYHHRSREWDEQDEPRLIIVDWKFGRHPVEAAGNRQLAAYAVMLLCGTDTFAGDMSDWADDDIIRLMIVQPSAEETHDNPVRRASLTLGQVREEAARLDALVDEMTDEAVPVRYNPTRANCRWCEAARSLRCPMVTRTMREASVIRTGADRDLPAYLYGEFLATADLVGEFAGHIRADARRRMEAGEDVPGLKLIPGRAPNRRWRDEAAAASALSFGDHPGTLEIYDPPRLKSVSRLEREFRAHKATASLGTLAEHTVRGEPTTQVAFADDRGETLGEQRVREAIAHFTNRRLTQ